jgi:hypothetical protein
MLDPSFTCTIMTKKISNHFDVVFMCILTKNHTSLLWRLETKWEMSMIVMDVYNHYVKII